ncbi:MAG TPA: tetratricopeptide repeat protein [Bacteroidia bacterium]|nr:tetratricopeptide repeat protein [Bacteroidia bacterium]
MADHFTYAKLPADPCLTQEQLLAYIDGKLSVDAQHACEKHMLDCDMCSDAAEGLALVKDRAALAAPVQSNGAGVAEKGKVVSLNQNQSNRKLWYSIAAVLVLVLASTFFFQQVSQNEDMSTMADNQAKMDSIADPSSEFAAAPATDCLSRRDKSILKDGDGSPANAPKMAPLATQEKLEKDYNTDGDDAKNLEAEVRTVAKPEAANDQNFDLAVGDENVPVERVTVEKLKEEDVIESEPEKKGAFWEKTKLVLTAPNANTQTRSEEQSLSQDGDRVAKQDQPKDAEAKSGEGKKEDDESPPAPEAATVNAVGAANEDYAGGATDTVQANVPVLMNDANKDLGLSYTNGVNMMNSGQYNSAIALFDEVLQDSTHVRYEDAEFLKAKTLIKASRKDEAKTLLKSIEMKKGKHAAEATELLKTL